MKASVRDLRLRAGELLAAVERGESVEITYRGRSCARLVGAGDQSGPPLNVREGDESAHAYAEAADVHANPAFGMWADRTEPSVEALIDKWRAPRDFDGNS